MCGAKASQVIVPLIDAPSLVFASTVKTPPVPDLASVTLPDPLAEPPPRTVVIWCDGVPVLTASVIMSPDPSLGLQSVSASDRPSVDCWTLHISETME